MMGELKMPRKPTVEPYVIPAGDLRLLSSGPLHQNHVGSSDKCGILASTPALQNWHLGGCGPENLHLRQLPRPFFCTWMFENIGLRQQFAALAAHVKQTLTKWWCQTGSSHVDSVGLSKHRAFPICTKSLSKPDARECFLTTWAALGMLVETAAFQALSWRFWTCGAGLGLGICF